MEEKEQKDKSWYERNSKLITIISVIILTFVGAFELYNGAVSKHDQDVTFDNTNQLIIQQLQSDVKRLYEMRKSDNEANEKTRQILKDEFENDIKELKEGKLDKAVFDQYKEDYYYYRKSK